MLHPKKNRCTVCGLIARDVEGDPPRCPDTERCRKYLRGETLGGEQWPSKPTDETPEVPEYTNGVH